jgi:hypothetical protein
MKLTVEKKEKATHVAAVGHAARTYKGQERRAITTARNSAATPTHAPKTSGFVIPLLCTSTLAH